MADLFEIMLLKKKGTVGRATEGPVSDGGTNSREGKEKC